MTSRVRDFMNGRLVYIRAGDRPEIALHHILELGITAVPVLDEDERPVGVASMRDLVDPRKRNERVSAPVITCSVDEPLISAARRLAETGVHHLVVVDENGRAAGMLSALDVVRGLLGLPAKHPEAITTL